MAYTRGIEIKEINMQAVKIRDNIYWVGAIDWNLRNFHGYETGRGSTYNAYLVIDEHITLIDTVKAQFSGEMIERIESVCPVESIDYIISNHVEPDHSGAIKDIVAKNPDVTVFTSFPSGEKGLRAYYGDMKYRPIKSGESISLGKNTVNFVTTPMVHWPDNMVAYFVEEKILFSNDALGEHYATAERFASEVDKCKLFQEVDKYYANIVLPYSAQVRNVLKVVDTLDISMIAPSHGVVWDTYVDEVIERYNTLANATFEEKSAVVVYDTMWHSTEEMARAIAEGFREKGVKVIMKDLKYNHESDVIVDVMKAQYVAVGSPTLNNHMMPNVAKFLCYMSGLTNKNKKYVAFGSYGWGGQSIAEVDKQLEDMKLERMTDMIRVQYRPTEETLANIKEQIVSAID